MDHQAPIIYVQKHSILHFGNGAGPYMQYESIQNEEQILMELINHLGR